MLLITRFNKMIRNKVIWGILVAAFGLSLVIYLGPREGGCSGPDSNRERGVVGKLYGENVSTEEYYLARFFEMGMRDISGLTPEGSRFLRKRTWTRLAALRTAEEMGISVSNDEIREAIRRDSSFAVNGVFSKERYQSVLGAFLNVRDADIIYESYRRQDLMLMKLIRSLESSVWTAPEELTEKLNNLTDLFVVEYIELNQDDYIGDVDVTIEDAEKFFNENKEFFMIPEKINVKYVEFPITNYLSEEPVKEDDILEYYSEHQDEYSVVDTNDISLPIPLEDVQDEIVSILEREYAVSKAKDIATAFVITLAPNRYGKALGIDETAARNDMTIFVSDYFSLNGDVPEMNVDETFNQAAFGLDPSDPERYFSDAVVGEDAVYVMAANDRIEAREPEFNEVTNMVMPLAKLSAENAAFLEKSVRIRNSFEESMVSEKTFTESAQELDLTVTTTKSFSVYDDFSSNETEYSEVLIPNILTTKEGELTELMEIEDGMLLACVTDRGPGDLVSMQLLRPQLLSTLDRYRAGILFEDWGDYVLNRAGLEDQLPAIRDDDDQTTDNEAPPSGEMDDG